jgi:hypothetical protein
MLAACSLLKGMVMRSSLRVAVVAPFVLAVAACSSAPGEDVAGSSVAAISGSTIVSRGMEWVDAGLHYCQAARGAYDGDESCWAWEGGSHICDRESNAAWNAYRSDCSGFVTFAWGLPPVGDGGYVTSEFAPYDNSFSHVIDGIQLQPGDALNKTPDEHIVLFKEWVTVGESAVFMEEPGCSVSTPYAHEFTSNVSISGSEVYISYEGATFYAIRYNGSGGGGGTTDACSYGDGYCTSTMQCDGGDWVPRSSDPTACTSGPGASGGSGTGNTCSEGDGYCTSTLQCDAGHWVSRTNDPTACTSGPGASGGGATDTCTEGDGYCTATQQCDNHHWVARSSDPAACTSGPGTGGAVTDACSHGDGYCTGTLQCDNGHWIARADDSAACTSVVSASESCTGGDGYCTATLQCDGGHWVTRTSDSAACTSGPGA